MEKLIITAAVTGSITTRTRCPYLPHTPREIADETVRAWEAGAAMVHLHMRDDNGNPTPDPNRFRETIELIKAKCDIIINTTTGGGRTQGVPLDGRIAVVPTCRPEMAALDVGATTLGAYDKSEGKWVPDRVGGLTFSELQHCAEVWRANGARPEVEVFDISGIHATSLLVEAGALQPPLHFGLVLGMAGQVIPASPKNLLFMVESLPPHSTWTCIAIGKHEFTLGAVAIVLGGHVRVGFEDNIYLARGVLAKSNGELVEKMARIARELGRDIASPAEARRILSLD